MFRPMGDSTPSIDVVAAREALKAAVGRARARDHAAFEILYFHYGGMVWKHIFYAVGDEECAKDLFQEVWKRVWEYLPGAGGDLQFGPWLNRVAGNVVADYFRRESRRKGVIFLSDSEDELDDEQYSAYVSLSMSGIEERVCIRECLERALAQVPLRSRLCLVLQDLYGYSQDEISRELGIDVKTVGSHICRARERFRQAYRYFLGESDVLRKGEWN